MSDTISAIRARDRAPTHPGAVLREDVLPAVGRSKVEIARLLANPAFADRAAAMALAKAL